MGILANRSLRFQTVVRPVLLLAVAMALSAGPLTAGTIWFTTTSLGGNSYRYEYAINFSLLQNQEVDLRFDPALYTGLNNGTANSDFQLALLQPGNPSGAFGDYSILALIDNPSLVGPFSVEFMFLGAGLPGGQPYFVHQFDPTGQNIIGTLASGNTAPEPSSWLLAGVGLVVSGLLRRTRSRK
jgi:PEP-CTERM motif